MARPDETLPDADLLAGARAGDRAALDALVARHEARVYRFAVRICGREDGADVAQDTLLAMARSLEGFRGDAELSTWLYTIARRFCLRARRRRVSAPAREQSLESLSAAERGALASPARDPERQLESTQWSEALGAAISALPPAQREVLILRDIEGLSAQDAGKVLGLGVAAVKSRLHRARQAVQARLAPVFGLTPSSTHDRSREVVSLFSRYLEGDLAPDACARMETHLAGCGDCSAACASLKRVLALCREERTSTVPAAVKRSVRRAIREYLGDR
jgi:RNA polymerase sigma-70 factor (ECF subfamily)